jgi:hypothetical protein
MKNIFFILFFLSFFISCKKDVKNEAPVVVPTGNLQINFAAQANTYSFSLGQSFVTANLDTLTITKFKYFISNVVLTKEDNTTYSVPECYHVIDHSSTGKKTISLNEVPVGNYRSIKFMLGVDSARNRSGAQTNGLDPANEATDMYWTWSSGYIMIKVEGTSPQSGNGTKAIEYHMGGFGGVNKTQRTFDLNFGINTLTVADGKDPQLFLNSNIAEFFRTPTKINVNTTYGVLSAGATAKIFADNYADMITFDHLQN